jgi:hypothetical protein
MRSKHDGLMGETAAAERSREDVRRAAEQGDEADEAKHIGASQLIPGVGPTLGER